jgi:hypothetical protein
MITLVDKANVHVYTFLHMFRKVAILILAEIFIVMEIKPCPVYQGIYIFLR